MSIIVKCGGGLKVLPVAGVWAQINWFRCTHFRAATKIRASSAYLWAGLEGPVNNSTHDHV